MNDETGDNLAEVVKDFVDVAGTTAKAVEKIEKTKTGKFLGKVFGDVIENGVGMVGDAIKFKRFELYLRHVQKTKDNLEKRGINLDADATRAVPPKIALPIFENASLEDDDELHTLWSNLLANAMDPNFIGDVKSKHVSILKELEPLDLRVLHSCYEEKIKYRADKKFDEALFDKAKIVAVFGIADDLIEVALLSLMRQGCIKGGNIKTNLSFGDTPNTIYTGTNSFSVSLLGAELCRAVLTS